MDLTLLSVAAVVVLLPFQVGVQLAAFMGLVGRRSSYKTMSLSWLTILIINGAAQQWELVGLDAAVAAVWTVVWWLHGDDDDDDEPRRKRRRLWEAMAKRLPRPVASARPTPTGA